ncbi:MAG: 4Fe-4S binding protein [Desulfopila sp.]|jgi:ferredoxin|nr:4Fe-4S binding protein [Desulfopila sp.]
MHTSFSTTCVCAGDDGRIILESYRGTLRPGQPFEVDLDSNVLMAGGFTLLSPDTPFPLSPTLQLQLDFASSTETELQDLAEAELLRLQALTYQAYQVNADPRVCVISSRVTELNTFIETYGGVLDIHAVLVNSTSLEYPQVTDFKIDQTAQGCRVHYTRRSPINMQQCTYCGACGATCPERCITPHLLINFEQCSSCKECEKVCPSGAVDILAMEEVTVTVPAVILLADINDDTTDTLENVYRENDLERYFKTVFSDEIKEVVCHNNSICQYSGRLGTGCARCVDSCPHQALSRNERGIAIDHIRCRECGNCIAVCPTGAMQNGYFSDEVLLQYLHRIGAGRQRNLIIGDEHSLHLLWWLKRGTPSENTLFLEYPTVQALSLFHFLLFFSAGYQRITVLQGENESGNTTLLREIEKGNAVISSLFGLQDCVNSIDPSKYQGEGGGTERPHPLRSFHIPQTFKNRRAALVDILQHMLAAAGKDLDVRAMSSDFLSVTCDDANCTQCLACLNECRTSALQADEENLSLTYNGGLCVGCGVCVEVCPENVLSMAANTRISEQFLQRKSIAQAEAAKCKRCGAIFGTRKSLDRVMEILSSRESVNTEHFEYCSTCRVVKLFETETT